MNNLTKLSEQEQREVITIKSAREGFPEYCVAIDPRYSLKWFHHKIALRLERAVKQIENGEDVRLMIFMPPRHGKSDSATQKFPSWVLGQHPEWPFIVASYSQELATDFGQGTRDLMDRPNYKAIFDTRIREDTTAKAKWMTEEGGGYTAVGVGGAITGRGFKVGIVDDPFKNREEADSPVTRESVHKWWRSTFYTRQEGSTCIILILTRWHDDDLAGRLLKEQKEAEKAGETDYDKWEVMEFKAIAEKEEENRKVGEALWPEKFSTSKLNVTKAALGSYEWSALYQQNPIDEESQEFKKNWLQYRTWGEVEKMVTRKFATIDPAGKKNETSDFTGVTRNYVNDLNEWNIKSRRYRLNSKGVVDLIFELHSECFETIGIEEGIYTQAVEPFLRDKMDELGIYPNVVPLKHGGIMKETRIRGLIPRYENRKIFHIDNTCSDLEEEYERFPKSAYDDCLDSEAYQNQIAAPPSAGKGDRISQEDIEKNLTSEVNDQTGSIIIGVSSALPGHFIIGNKRGLFFNAVNPQEEDLWARIRKYLKKWEKCYIFGDIVGEGIGIRKLQQDYPGKVFVCYLTTDPKSQQVIKWGDGEKYGEIEVSRSSLIQTLVDEFQHSYLSIHGSKKDWEPFTKDWNNLFRAWEENSIGEKTPWWETSGPTPFVKAAIYFRVGLEKFGTSQAQVVGDDMFAGIPFGRIFNE